MWCGLNLSKVSKSFGLNQNDSALAYLAIATFNLKDRDEI